MIDFSEQQLSLIKSIVNNYLGEADTKNNEQDTHSGVDRLLLGGVIIECRKLVAEIEADLASKQEQLVPDLERVEG